LQAKIQELEANQSNSQDKAADADLNLQTKKSELDKCDSKLEEIITLETEIKTMEQKQADIKAEISSSKTQLNVAKAEDAKANGKIKESLEEFNKRSRVIEMHIADIHKSIESQKELINQIAEQKATVNKNIEQTKEENNNNDSNEGLEQSKEELKLVESDLKEIKRKIKIAQREGFALKIKIRDIKDQEVKTKKQLIEAGKQDLIKTAVVVSKPSNNKNKKK